MRFLQDKQAIETSEVVVIIVGLAINGAHQLLDQKIAEIVRDIAGII